jgi:hypothetical protein
VGNSFSGSSQVIQNCLSSAAHVELANDIRANKTNALYSFMGLSSRANNEDGGKDIELSKMKEVKETVPRFK